MSPQPFPAITGGCYCTAVRYRLLTSPLFCFACHCTDCQKATGSAFALHASIETHNIRIISDAQPSLVTLAPDPALPRNAFKRAVCLKCGTLLWGNYGPWGYAVSDVRIGTLDFPSIMEPDFHSFVGSKLGWVELPRGAKTSKGHFDHAKVWPKSSLKRLEMCLERFEAAKAAASREGGPDEVVGERDESPVDGDGDKTPTAIGYADDGEDDEAFERRFRETERALQERLAKLSLKLESENKQSPNTTTT